MQNKMSRFIGMFVGALAEMMKASKTSLEL